MVLFLDLSLYLSFSPAAVKSAPGHTECFVFTEGSCLSLPASASCSWYLIFAPAFHFPPNVSSTYSFLFWLHPSTVCFSVCVCVCVCVRTPFYCVFLRVCVCVLNRGVLCRPPVSFSRMIPIFSSAMGKFCLLLCLYWPEWTRILLSVKNTAFILELKKIFTDK